MTWAEKEVPSLELCKRLKELGYPRELNSGWYWRRKISPKVEYELVFIKRFPKVCPLFDFPLDPDEFKGECCVGGECKKGSSIEDWIKCEENPLIKAPTCRELSLNLYWCNKCLSFNVEKKEIENSEYAFYICRDCGHRFRMKEIRFLVHPKTQCWIWLGAINKDGYGHFKQRGKIIDAHKAFYEAIIGEVPKGKHLHHKCGNTLCVNPFHLEVLSVSKHCQTRKTCKLTTNDVKKILSLKGVLSSRKVAEQFNISKTLVVDIWNRKKWKDL